MRANTLPYAQRFTAVCTSQARFCKNSELFIAASTKFPIQGISVLIERISGSCSATSTIAEDTSGAIPIFFQTTAASHMRAVLAHRFQEALSIVVPLVKLFMF